VVVEEVFNAHLLVAGAVRVVCYLLLDLQ